MRVASAAVTLRKGRTSTRSGLPAPGSKLRLLYDILYEYRGQFVPDCEMSAVADLVAEGASSRSRASRIHDARVKLVNFYGCDIRCGARGGATHISRISLVGEWCGRVYLDYTEPASLAAAAAERASVLEART